MESLIVQLTHSLDQLRNSKGSELVANLEFVLTIIEASPTLPLSLLKIILVRTAGVAKTKEVNNLSLEILQKLINSSFISELFEDTQENSMILTILMSALVTNIEKNDAALKKSSWQSLVNLIQSLPDRIIKACYPGLLKIVVEELKTYRCQGLGTNESNFVSALTCTKCLQRVFIRSPNDEWRVLANEKARGAFQTIKEELVLITNLGLTREFLCLIEVFKLSLQVLGESEENFKCLIRLSGLSKISIDVTVPEELLSKIVLEKLAGLTNGSLEEKISGLQVVNTCLELIGNELAVLVNVYKQVFVKFLFESLQIVNPVYYERFNKADWILFVEKSDECLNLLEKFVQVSVKYEIFDIVFEEQHKLLRKVKKKMSQEEVQKIFAICLIFSQIYPESSLHILSELIFSESIQSKFLIFCRFLLASLSFSLFLANELSLIEVLENILLTHSSETSKECSALLESIQAKHSSHTIGQLLKSNEDYLLSSLSLKLKLFGPVPIQSGLIQYLQFTNCQESIKKVIKNSLSTFDTKHQSYTATELLSFFNYFQNLISTLKFCLKSHSTQLTTGNIIRDILMRTKSFLGLKPNSIENRKILNTCLNIFNESLELINNVPFEIDPLDHSAFAFEEDPNVSIPNGLSELCFEFLPNFVFCFKMMADLNCEGISMSLIAIFKKIHEFDEEFFLTERRFSLRFFGFVKILLRNKNFSASGVRLKVGLLELLLGLGKKVVGDVKEQVLESCEGLVGESQEINELVLRIKKEFV